MLDIGIIDDALVGPSTWRDWAACEDSTLMMPPTTAVETGAGWRPSAEAVSLCEQCPVAIDCLAYALAGNERWGLWGGASITERDRLRRQVRETDADEATVAAEWVKGHLHAST